MHILKKSQSLAIKQKHFGFYLALMIETEGLQNSLESGDVLCKGGTQKAN